MSGKFKAALGSETCSGCGAGTFSLSAGASVCADCQARGTCKPGFSGPKCGSCIHCVKGKYKIAQGDAACTNCVVGQYSTSVGATFNLCQGCPTDSDAPEASSEKTACTCNAGSTGPNGGPCTKCVEGTYKVNSGNTKCKSCPANADSPSGSIMLSACTCNAGSSGLDGDTCSECASGTYKSTSGSKSCSTCPANAASAQASTKPTDCMCYKGFTEGIAVPCVACMNGKFKPSTGPADCTSCPSGSTSRSGSVLVTDCLAPTTSATHLIKMVVMIPMSMAEFSNEKQTKFKEAVAAAAGVAPDDVSFDKIEEISTSPRRFTKSIRMDVSVKASSSSRADAIAGKLTASAINTQLGPALGEVAVVQSPKVTSTEEIIEKDIATPSKVSDFIWIGIAVGMLLLCSVFVFFVRYLRNTSKSTRERRSPHDEGRTPEDGQPMDLIQMSGYNVHSHDPFSFSPRLNRVHHDSADTELSISPLEIGGTLTGAHRGDTCLTAANGSLGYSTQTSFNTIASEQRSQAFQQELVEVKATLGDEAQRKNHEEKYSGVGIWRGSVPLIDYQDLSVDSHALSHGSFKTVYAAKWLSKDKDVAVLVLRNSLARAEMQQEIEIFETLGRHQHLAQLFGLSTLPDSGTTCMVMEFAGLGSLDHVLQKVHESGHDVNDAVLLTMAMQACDGLNHLGLHKIVHRDVAIRNVLCFSFNHSDHKMVLVKVTDYGRSLTASREGKTMAEIGTSSMSAAGPMRYMAPENITRRTYSLLSDVFSYGIMLWEIWTLGEVPYGTIGDDQAVATAVIGGTRLPRPPTCPPDVYAIMHHCWNAVPHKRPDMSQIYAELQDAFADAIARASKPECVICLAKEPVIALMPCGHMCVCEDCGPVLKQCPVCRADVLQAARIYH